MISTRTTPGIVSLGGGVDQLGMSTERIAQDDDGNLVLVVYDNNAEDTNNTLVLVLSPNGDWINLTSFDFEPHDPGNGYQDQIGVVAYGGHIYISGRQVIYDMNGNDPPVYHIALAVLNSDLSFTPGFANGIVNYDFYDDEASSGLVMDAQGRILMTAFFNGNNGLLGEAPATGYCQYWVQSDANYNVTTVTKYDFSGFQGTEHFTTDPKGGNRKTYDASWSEITESFNFNFGWQGTWFDQYSGLYYIRNRGYDPELMRWLQPDPIGTGDSVNWYQSLGSNPVRYTDASGLCKEEQSDPTQSPVDFTLSTLSETLRELSSLSPPSSPDFQFGSLGSSPGYMPLNGDSPFDRPWPGLPTSPMYDPGPFGRAVLKMDSLMLNGLAAIGSFMEENERTITPMAIESINSGIAWQMALGGGTAVVSKLAGGFGDLLMDARPLAAWFAKAGKAANVVEGAAEESKIAEEVAGAAKAAENPGFVDLADEIAREHTLEGDITGGGGHRYGTGISGKSEFPSDWSDDKIMHTLSDITTDPGSRWSPPNRWGYVTATKNVDGVDIKVVYDTMKGRIVSGYPTNMPRNP